METAVANIQSEQELVQQLYEKLLRHWNNSNAHAYADLFDSNASVVGFDGSQMNGKEQIKNELSKIFKDHKVASYISIVEDIKQLADGCYLLRAVAGMIPPGKNDIMPERNAIQSMIAL